MKITPAQLSAFYKEKGATENCPFCQQDKWSAPLLPTTDGLYREDETMDILEMAIPLVDATGMNNARMPIIALTCINCGLVRFQHVMVLNTWLTKKGQ